MRTLLTLLFATLVFALIGISDANDESQKEVDMKRRFRPMNPYSWMNYRNRRSLDESAELDDEDSVSLPALMDKRAYRRNPYAWSRFSANTDVDQPGIFDTLFGGVKDKKSPYQNYNGGRIARHPYFRKSNF